MTFLLVLLLSVLAFECQGFPNYDYSGDDYNYNDNQYTDNEPIENPEEEIKYDIKFLNIGGSQIVDKGTTIKLPCIVDKYPENFVVMWKKVEPGKSAGDILVMGSQKLKNDNRITVEINREGEKKVSTLVIALAEDSDAGHYVCQLGSNEKKELKHTVTIRDPPSIVKTPSNGLYKAHKGDDVTLICVGSGNPKPVITWTRLIYNHLPTPGVQYLDNYLPALKNKKLPDGREKMEA